MRWFRRKNRPATTELEEPTTAMADADAEQEAAASDLPTNEGPYDISAAPNRDEQLIDLGVLKVPTLANVAMKIEIDAKTRKPTLLALTMANTAVSVQVFAAPKSTGIWQELLAERRELAAAQNADITEQHGPLGREMVVKIPVRTPAGNGIRAMRFTGVEGPRWLLQATFYGDAAINPAAAAVLEDLVRQMVVDRGSEPHPPKHPIALTLPTQSAEEGQNPALQAPKRGPEITETR